jgi:hypothetical protein
VKRQDIFGSGHFTDFGTRFGFHITGFRKILLGPDRIEVYIAAAYDLKLAGGTDSFNQDGVQ